MVRILIVDDEREIRNGLVKQIPWSAWGVDEVLDADDGDTALEMALARRPDHRVASSDFHCHHAHP